MDVGLKKLKDLSVKQNECHYNFILNKTCERMTERFKVSDCKSAGETYRRFESYFFQKNEI